MPKPKPSKPWLLADAILVDVDTTHPCERQRHLIFQNGVRLVIGNSSQLPLAAELIVHLRKVERHQKGGRS